MESQPVYPKMYIHFFLLSIVDEIFLIETQRFLLPCYGYNHR